MRRGSDDQQWQEVKRIVRERDHDCDRLAGACGAVEYLMLQKFAPSIQIHQRDPAHIIAVSKNPDIMYDANNIVTLNRWSHENLDNCRHPVTGKPITPEQRKDWWRRIAGPQQWQVIEDYYF